MQYYLMNKDVVVGEFELVEDYGVVRPANFKSRGVLPLGFKSIRSWLESRRPAKHRQHIQQIMKECGCDTLAGYIRVIHCTSLNDTYWVKSVDEDTTWVGVSLYSNEYNDIVAKLSFEGIGLFGQQMSSTSPEFSTSGSFSKCWIRDNDGIFLYKRGTEGYANAGLEPYSEALSSELYSIITENSTSYKLVTLHRKLASKCKLFTSDEVGLVTYSKIYEQVDCSELEYFTSIGSEELYRAMLVADAVCFNQDRHMGNYGVLVNNATQQILQMSPIYDNNLSMLCYAMKSDFEDIDKYLSLVSPKIGESWIHVAQQVLTPRLRSILINLKGYELPFEGDDKFENWRVKEMNRLINRQISLILE